MLRKLATFGQLAVAFLAIAGALAVLPACGDDSGNDSQRPQFE
jgi:hypothetical protein